MVRRNRIIILLCIAAVIMLSITAYGGKHEKECSLPATVEAAVKALFPNGVISESKQEEEEIKVYEIEVKDGDKESDLKVAKDGTIMEVESDENTETVPAAVTAAIEAQNAELKEVDKEVEYARVQVVALDTPIITYSAEIIKDGEKIELKIAADGTILKQHEAEERKCHKDKDDDDKDNDEEMDD